MNSPHSNTRARKSVRSTRLALQTLEDRCTPATAVYAATTQTLTVRAAEGDLIQVAQIPSQLSGFIQVSAGSTVFDSSVHVQPVRNLIVRFNGVNTGGLSLLTGLRLGGDVSVFGAKKTQSLASFAKIGGNVTYTASASANDVLTFFSATRVGGNMKLDLRAGHNTVSLRGGDIGGKLAVTGAAGADHIELTENSNLWVGGSASFVLGNGLNEVVTTGSHEFDVGQSLTFKGGSDYDVFDLDSDSGNPRTALRVGHNFVANLGAALNNLPDPIGNRVRLSIANIGGNLDITGGLDYDLVSLHDLTLGGDFRASMGDGGNSLYVAYGGSFPVGDSIIGGNLYYTGGGFSEDVHVFRTTVYNNVSINIGDVPFIDRPPFNQVELGIAEEPVSVYGSLTIVSGTGAEFLSLENLSVGNGITLETGSYDDSVYLNDVSVTGQTSINLGAGSDDLRVEVPAGHPLDGISSFGGEFNVNAGSGDDQVNLSDDLDGTTRAHFGGKVTLKGGGGIDTLNSAGNLFSVTGNFEDFELGASLP